MFLQPRGCCPPGQGPHSCLAVPAGPVTSVARPTAPPCLRLQLQRARGSLWQWDFVSPAPLGARPGSAVTAHGGDEPPVPPCPCQRCPEVTAPGVLGSKCPQPRAKPLLGLPTWGWLTPRGHIQGEGRAWGGQAPPAQFLPMGFGVWVGDAGCPQAPALRSDGHQGQSHQVWVRPRDTRSLSPAPRCHCRHPKIAGGSSSASSQGPRGGL